MEAAELIGLDLSGEKKTNEQVLIEEETGLNCKKCFHKFKRNHHGRLQKHMLRMHRTPEDLEQKAFAVKMENENDLNESHPDVSFENRVKCQSCLNTFKTPDSLRNHIRREHKGDVLQGVTTENQSEARANDIMYARSCPFCSNTYINRKDLRNHRNRKHPGMTVKGEVVCKMCSEIVKTSFMTFHYKHKHLDTTKTEGAYDKTICQYCQKIFHNMHNLATHMKFKHSEAVAIQYKAVLMDGKNPVTQSETKHGGGVNVAKHSKAENWGVHNPAGQEEADLE